jgi:hypothetical protein
LKNEPNIIHLRSILENQIIARAQHQFDHRLCPSDCLSVCRSVGLSPSLPPCHSNLDAEIESRRRDWMARRALPGQRAITMAPAPSCHGASAPSQPPARPAPLTPAAGPPPGVPPRRALRPPPVQGRLNPGVPTAAVKPPPPPPPPPQQAAAAAAADPGVLVRALAVRVALSPSGAQQPSPPPSPDDWPM